MKCPTLRGFLRNNYRRNLDGSKLVKCKRERWSAGGLTSKLAQHCIKTSGQQTVRIHGEIYVEHGVHQYPHPIQYSDVHRLEATLPTPCRKELRTVISINSTRSILLRGDKPDKPDKPNDSTNEWSTGQRFCTHVAPYVAPWMFMSSNSLQRSEKPEAAYRSCHSKTNINACPHRFHQPFPLLTWPS